MRFRLLVLPLVALVLLPACRDAKITSYRVPHEMPEPMPPVLSGGVGPATNASADMATMANTAVPTAAGDGLGWTAPAHWKTKPQSAMRKGSYAIAGDDGTEADMAVTAFPGDVGGDLANVNRWRGQIELPPIGEAELARTSQHLDFNGLHCTFVDFANPDSANPQRILGAIVPFEGATWFFKMMGPDALVAREKTAFLQFLQTVRPRASQP